MNRRVLSIFVAILLGHMVGLGMPGPSAWATNLPPKGQGSFTFDTAEAPVLKVYSADEDGFKYVAYLVKWNGVEVIVDDPLARTQFREGDTIHFMVQKFNFPSSSMSSPTMKFLLVDNAQLVGGGEGDTHNNPHFSQEAEKQPKSLIENLTWTLLPIILLVLFIYLLFRGRNSKTQKYLERSVEYMNKLEKNTDIIVSRLDNIEKKFNP